MALREKDRPVLTWRDPARRPPTPAAAALFFPGSGSGYVSTSGSPSGERHRPETLAEIRRVIERVFDQQWLDKYDKMRTPSRSA